MRYRRMTNDDYWFNGSFFRACYGARSKISDGISKEKCFFLTNQYCA